MIVDLAELRPTELAGLVNGRVVVVDRVSDVAATGPTIREAQESLDAVHEEYAAGRRVKEQG